MNRTLLVLALLGASLFSGCSANTGASLPLQPQSSTNNASAAFARASVRSTAVCPPVAPGYGRCFALMRVDETGHPLVVRPGHSAPDYDTNCFKGDVVCYGPSDLRKAYDLPSGTHGAGQTVAVIDAYGDPKAESDLAEYRSNYGIAPCTTKNGCFLKIAGNGSTKKFPPLSEGWAGEESLDVDMVSAICPKCHIILVEAVTNSFADFEAAERIGVEHGATVISNSWGGNEYAAADAAYDHPGVAITASAGDNGYDTCAAKCAGPQDPAAFSSVIAVGGTTMLPSAATARGFTETAWNCYNDAPRACDASTIYATGSGCASRAPIPAWQSGTGCTMRAYNDVSAVADVTTGVHIYDSYYGGWLVYGGTSVASPIVASAIALAGNAAKLHGAESMWRSHGKGLNDITSGDNVIPKGHGAFPRTCLPAYPEICTAGPGFDGPTGWGTPNGLSGL